MDDGKYKYSEYFIVSLGDLDLGTFLMGEIRLGCKLNEKLDLGTTSVIACYKLTGMCHARDFSVMMVTMLVTRSSNIMLRYFLLMGH